MNIAVIFAGGTGQRMNTASKPKQFLELHSKPILIYTLENFQNHQQIDGIILVCLENWIDYCNELLRKYHITKVLKVVPGGNSGQESIFNGLKAANDVIGEDLSVSFVEISADDERFTHIKNKLSNPDKLKVYEVVVQDGDGLQVEQVEGEVTLRIKLDETFDASKINVYRVSSTSSQEPYQFLYADGFVEVQTSEFGIYAISQVSGFKPAAPSGNGSNTIALVLIIVGGLAVIVAVVVSICIGLRKKSN